MASTRRRSAAKTRAIGHLGDEDTIGPPSGGRWFRLRGTPPDTNTS
jgi:hypothetical protein